MNHAESKSCRLQMNHKYLWNTKIWTCDFGLEFLVWRLIMVNENDWRLIGIKGRHLERNQNFLKKKRAVWKIIERNQRVGCVEMSPDSGSSTTPSVCGGEAQTAMRRTTRMICSLCKNALCDQSIFVHLPSPADLHPSVSRAFCSLHHYFPQLSSVTDLWTHSDANCPIKWIFSVAVSEFFPQCFYTKWADLFRCRFCSGIKRNEEQLEFL